MKVSLCKISRASSNSVGPAANPKIQRNIYTHPVDDEQAERQTCSIYGAWHAKFVASSMLPVPL